MALVVIVSIDLIVLTFVGMKWGADTALCFRGACHLISLVWASLFYWNRFFEVNRDIANQCFFTEWADIILSMIVIFFLHHACNEEEDCHDEGSCFDLAICLVLSLSPLYLLSLSLYRHCLLYFHHFATYGMDVTDDMYSRLGN